jgi:hypothetical protein
MTEAPEPTTLISMEQGWRLIWEELRKVDIAPGQGDPFAGGVHWGQRANQAVQGLRDLRLPLLAVHQVSLLLQAVIRASEVRFGATSRSEPGQ